MFYRPKYKFTAASIDANVINNPLLLFSKNYIHQLPRRTRVIFFQKLIIYAANTRDYKTIAEGLEHLFKMFPELYYDWKIANRQYLGDDEGERIYMLYKNAFGKMKNAGKIKAHADWQ